MFGRRLAILPIDPQSGGTWIAASDAGWMATLLNVNLTPAHREMRQEKRSRGEIIPALLRLESAGAALEAAQKLDLEKYPPFRVVFIDAAQIGEMRSDGATARVRRHSCDSLPLMFASSGLGDAFVDSPRRALFEEMFTRGADLAVQQDRYHRHSWPDRPHVSVCMRRAEARTVSHSVVELNEDRVRLSYVGDAPDQPITPITLELSRPDPAS